MSINFNLAKQKEIIYLFLMDGLFNKYFKWKYAAPNRHATTTRYLNWYRSEKLYESNENNISGIIF